MKTIAFSSRNAKEMLRDKTNIFFGIGFPVVLLLLLSLIQANIPVEMFAIERLAPGIAVFGLSFISLFSGFIIAKDRASYLTFRLFTSPMKAENFIVGYTLPMLPMALAQILVCFFVSLFLGLTFNARIFLTIVVLIPAAVLFIGIGLLCGTVFTDRQVGGVCGALLTNLSAWLSGIWFDTAVAGKGFETVANVLPFSHAVNAGRYAMAGDYAKIMPELAWVIGYAVFIMAVAIFVFMKKMDGENL